MAIRKQTAAHAAHASRRRKKAGEEFEQHLDQCHASAFERGLGVIEHLHPKVGGPPGHMFYREPAAVDYLGVYRDWPLAFDAKSVTGRTTFDLPEWGENGADLKRAVRQITYLLDFYRINKGRAVVFILAHCAKLDVCWLLEPPALEQLLAVHRVPLREDMKPRTPVRHLQPWLRAASELELARGAPRWDYLEFAYRCAVQRGARS